MDVTTRSYDATGSVVHRTNYHLTMFVAHLEYAYDHPAFVDVDWAVNRALDTMELDEDVDRDAMDYFRKNGLELGRQLALFMGSMA